MPQVWARVKGQHWMLILSTEFARFLLTHQLAIAVASGGLMVEKYKEPAPSSG